LKELRAEAGGLVEKLPYQEMADSPTIKQYVDWHRYEGYASRAPRLKGRAGPCEVLIINGWLADYDGGCGSIAVETTQEISTTFRIEDKMSARHFAALEEVVVVRLRGTPRGVITIRAKASGDGGFAPAHVVLEASEGFAGDVAVVADNEGNPLNSLFVEGAIGPGSSLSLATISAAGAGSSHVRLRLSVGRGAAVAARPAVIGGYMNSVSEEYILEGPQSSLEVIGLELGSGKSRIHHYVAAINDAEYTRGRVKLLAASLDEAWIVQRALGRITPKGRWSESIAEGVTYIASKSAVAVTQPILYIETGDVAGARHSAADASLDEDKAFYLRARGISEEEFPWLITLSLVDQYLSSTTESLEKLLRQYISILG
jgi:Fe-S cluster assembly scaffold protein SufB